MMQAVICISGRYLLERNTETLVRSRHNDCLQRHSR